MFYAAKIVTGQGTYDEANVERGALTNVVNHVANRTLGQTWDVFGPAGERVARIHPDGGVDFLAA